MNIKPRTHVIHEEGKQVEVEHIKADDGKCKCKAFLEPLRHTYALVLCYTLEC